jgi:hypothetical protein
MMSNVHAGCNPDAAGDGQSCDACVRVSGKAEKGTPLKVIRT